jgi:hypothetical protein
MFKDLRVKRGQWVLDPSQLPILDPYIWSFFAIFGMVDNSIDAPKVWVSIEGTGWPTNCRACRDRTSFEGRCAQSGLRCVGIPRAQHAVRDCERSSSAFRPPLGRSSYDAKS